MKLLALTPEVVAMAAGVEKGILDSGHAGSFSLEFHYPPNAATSDRGKPAIAKIVHPTFVVEVDVPLRQP